MLAHAAVHVQSLFSLSHGCKHVRVVELLFEHRQHDGQRTVRGSLSVCRCVCDTIWCSDNRKLTSSAHAIHLCVIFLRSGVISTFFSYACKTATGRMGPSLGAVSVFLNDFKHYAVFA